MTDAEKKLTKALQTRQKRLADLKKALEGNLSVSKERQLRAESREHLKRAGMITRAGNLKPIKIG